MVIDRGIHFFDKCARILSNIGAVAAGVILMAMIVQISAEIILRSFFNSTTYVLEEMIGYGIATMSFLGLGYTLNEGALIRMNLVLVKIGDTFFRRVMEVFCIFAALIFTCIAAWYFYTNSVRDFVRGHVSETLSETPLWLPPSIMLAGMLVFALQLLAYLLKVLAGKVSFSDEARARF